MHSKISIVILNPTCTFIACNFHLHVIQHPFSGDIFLLSRSSKGCHKINLRVRVT